MFDLILALRLTTKTFSLKKDSLRFPVARRIISAFIILPSFFFLIIFNRIFMLLDWIFFPGFRKLQLKKTAFIIGVPRSATTYLYTILAQDTEHFTCYKLWEIIFAPSIIQKYILLRIIKTDKCVGRPLYHFSLFLDRLFFNKISRLHPFSFSEPEEDEMLLLYAFASMYLTFFFPGVDALDPHFFFDMNISAKKRKKIMLFYKHCVQRHVYVFNRNEEKIYLSKNPCFMPKMVSIAETFPEAKLIYMLRSPLKTIPSTISLNANIYSVFSGMIKENPFANKTSDLIIGWYKTADEAIGKYWSNRNIIIPFKKITGQPQLTVNEIYKFLQLIPGTTIQNLLNEEQQRSENYESEHKYNTNNFIMKNEIALQLDFILNGKYKNEI
jgi:hypothetical protein